MSLFEQRSTQKSSIVVSKGEFLENQHFVASSSFENSFKGG